MKKTAKTTKTSLFAEHSFPNSRSFLSVGGTKTCFQISVA
jgi:hypothetical protein